LAEVHHIADALTLLPFLPAEAHALVDIGSGGGVPGIPLAIARPDVSILLVESTRKKSAFLNSAIASLELKNISITDQRAEDVGQSGWRGTFDVATARAVAALPWLIEWTIPLLKKGGKLLAMKGPKVHEEIPQSARAIRLLHTSEPVLYPANLPDTENHLIVELIKQGATDKRYPRSATIAKGKPL
jgi:16S rRNA (guanine527-N7)-methyltransferase